MDGRSATFTCRSPIFTCARLWIVIWGEYRLRSRSARSDRMNIRWRRVLGEIDRSWYPFDVGLVLAALDEEEAAWEAFDEVDFDGLDHWPTVWPTIALRYMFGDVWDTVSDDPGYAALVQRMDRAWGL